MAHRIANPAGPRLEALLDERDHLRIKLSLALDSDKPDHDAIRSAQLRLWELDRQIEQSWKMP